MPEIRGVTDGYDPSWYEELATLEAGNFWFVARNRLIKWLAAKYMVPFGSYLEVGCGSGFVMQMLAFSFPNQRIVASEFQPEGIEFAKKRVGPEVTFLQMDACAIPFRSEFDVVGAFDVIEHISDDIKALEEIHASLKPGGFVLLSVPQHMFLWSEYDVAGHHFRRYSRSELTKKLESSGFIIRFTTSFNALLLPIMILTRSNRRQSVSMETDVLEELRLPSWQNRILGWILYLEYGLMRVGFKFPYGGSRIVVAQKE